MKKIVSFQGLRGLGALTVFVWHSHEFIDNFCKIKLEIFFCAHFANLMFFMIAGLFVGLKLDSHSIDIMRFVKNKVLRFYPLYMITLLVSFLYLFYDNNWNIEMQHFIRRCPHLFLLQSWVPFYKYTFSFNRPAWFLSVMIFLWIITKPLLKLTEKINSKIKICIVCIVIILLLGISVYVMDRSIYLAKVVPKIILPFNVVPYFLGIMVGKNNKKIKILNYNNKVYEVIIIIGILLLLFVNYSLNRAFSYMLLMPYLMFLMLYLLNVEDNMVTRIIGSDLLVWLGDRSFEFYLIHDVVINFYKRMMIEFEEHIGGMEVVVFSFITSLFLSALVYKIKGKQKKELKYEVK